MLCFFFFFTTSCGIFYLFYFIGVYLRPGTRWVEGYYSWPQSILKYSVHCLVFASNKDLVMTLHSETLPANRQGRQVFGALSQKGAPESWPTLNRYRAETMRRVCNDHVQVPKGAPPSPLALQQVVVRLAGTSEKRSYSSENWRI